VFLKKKILVFQLSALPIKFLPFHHEKQTQPEALFVSGRWKEGIHYERRNCENQYPYSQIYTEIRKKKIQSKLSSLDCEESYNLLNKYIFI